MNRYHYSQLSGCLNSHVKSLVIVLSGCLPKTLLTFRVLTSYKDKCLHLWKTGDTKSGHWTECCNKMDHRYKLEWVKSPPTGLVCPPKIRKEKCRKKGDCSVCRYGRWGTWGECSVKCGGGTMSRYRQVITGLFKSSFGSFGLVDLESGVVLKFIYYDYEFFGNNWCYKQILS